MANVAQTFLRKYDRKILSGKTPFSQSEINKNDFTRLWVDGEYVIPKERLLVACEKMKLTEEERAELLSFVD